MLFHTVASQDQRGSLRSDFDVNVADYDFELRDGERWHVAQTLHHRENLANVHLVAQSFKVFLPRLRKTVRHSRKVRETISPVFPGYIFVALDVERDRWRSINGTFGVARLLSAEGRPIPVPGGGGGGVIF